jgi:transcriptional regulator with XRE-family HTH domain
MPTSTKAAEKKMSLKDKISAKSSDNSSKWPEEALGRSAKRGALQHARRVSLLVLRELEKQGLSQVALADKMGVSRQQVTKIVKGQENFTFETISKLEEALGISILTIDLRVVPAHLRVPTPASTSLETIGDDPELNLMGIKKRLENLNQLGQKLGLDLSETSKLASTREKTHGHAVPSELPALSEMEWQILQHLQSAQEFAAFEGPSRVFRMNNLKRSDWQNRIMELFHKLQQEPLEDFVIIGSADPSAPMPHGPRVPQKAQHKTP